MFFSPCLPSHSVLRSYASATAFSGSKKLYAAGRQSGGDCFYIMHTFVKCVNGVLQANACGSIMYTEVFCGITERSDIQVCTRLDLLQTEFSE